MIYLAAVCHDIEANSLEATWLERSEFELRPVKCRNYLCEQKLEFLDDCGAAGQKYVDLAGW